MNRPLSRESPTSGPFVNDPYGETPVSAVGAGVLDSPAGKPEKQQKSPANTDFVSVFAGDFFSFSPLY